MLESLSNLTIIKKAILSLIDNGKIVLSTDEDHRVEFELSGSEFMIRILTIPRSEKIILKTSLYVSNYGTLLKSTEVLIPMIGGNADGKMQLFYVKNFSNFLKTLS